MTAVVFLITSTTTDTDGPMELTLSAQPIPRTIFLAS